MSVLSLSKLVEIKEELILDKLDITNIARKLGISRPTVRFHAKKFGLHKGNKIKLKKHSLDLNYFKKIDTQEKAYVLGLLYADGCNTRKGLQLALVEKDKEVVEFVKNQLGVSNNLIFMPKDRPTWSNKWELSIKSMELSKQLTELGCPPAKSLIIKFPEFISKELLSHFIRGFFDGDGSISCRKGGWHASFTCGSYDFIFSLQEYLSRMGIYTKIYKSGKNKSCFILQLSRRLEIEKLMNYIYKGSTFSMNRKYIKAQQVLGERIEV